MKREVRTTPPPSSTAVSRIASPAKVGRLRESVVARTPRTGLSVPEQRRQSSVRGRAHNTRGTTAAGEPRRGSDGSVEALEIQRVYRGWRSRREAEQLSIYARGRQYPQYRRVTHGPAGGHWLGEGTSVAHVAVHNRDRPEVTLPRPRRMVELPSVVEDLRVEDEQDVPTLLAALQQIADEADDVSAIVAAGGIDLVAQKVEKVVYMDGGYNFGCAAGYVGETSACDGNAEFVVENWPANVTQYFMDAGGR